MLTEFSRTELLLGSEAMDKLKNAKVAVLVLVELVQLAVKL